ncbi:unnamed protein product [Notodromas monacha]|uniref:Uncharacterized protein n=1 Tax=Notodromas monacha TaxID=399045 RepID=A0A7R9BWZ2_9CRUS|nr:unnamed protein product [Notodromas monacha]CAG0922922.1 unnamed protein product [Notodromas monacha]
MADAKNLSAYDAIRDTYATFGLFLLFAATTYTATTVASIDGVVHHGYHDGNSMRRSSVPLVVSITRGEECLSTILDNAGGCYDPGFLADPRGGAGLVYRAPCATRLRRMYRHNTAPSASAAVVHHDRRMLRHDNISSAGGAGGMLDNTGANYTCAPESCSRAVLDNLTKAFAQCVFNNIANCCSCIFHASQPRNCTPEEIAFAASAGGVKTAPPPTTTTTTGSRTPSVQRQTAVMQGTETAPGAVAAAAAAAVIQGPEAEASLWHPPPLSNGQRKFPAAPVQSPVDSALGVMAASGAAEYQAPSTPATSLNCVKAEGPAVGMIGDSASVFRDDDALMNNSTDVNATVVNLSKSEKSKYSSSQTSADNNKHAELLKKNHLMSSKHGKEVASDTSRNHAKLDTMSSGKHSHDDLMSKYSEFAAKFAEENGDISGTTDNNSSSSTTSTQNIETTIASDFLQYDSKMSNYPFFLDNPIPKMIPGSNKTSNSSTSMTFTTKNNHDITKNNMHGYPLKSAGFFPQKQHQGQLHGATKNTIPGANFLPLTNGGAKNLDDLKKTVGQQQLPMVLLRLMMAKVPVERNERNDDEKRPH